MNAVSRALACALALFLLSASASAAPAAPAHAAPAAEPGFANPLVRQRADPQVFLHSDGAYYFTATVPKYDRIELRRARSLDDLGQVEAKVVWRKHASGPMSHHIWAPELHFIDGKWYLYFTAGRADAIWEMEISGHEWWGQDGKSIWYDWQYPKGEVFYVAGLDLKTGKRTAYNLQRDAWSIHFSSTRSQDLFAGDGADAGQVARAKDGKWIELFRPQKVMAGGAIDAPGYWHGGTFKSERLVNMGAHNYYLEPNVRFSPDKNLVVFRTNMFGAGYVLGVEVDKAAAGATDIRSTPELARQIKAAN